MAKKRASTSRKLPAIARKAAVVYLLGVRWADGWNKVPMQGKRWARS
jgi:hypothetical protein